MKSLSRLFELKRRDCVYMDCQPTTAYFLTLAYINPIRPLATNLWTLETIRLDECLGDYVLIDRYLSI
jgi:hypothetical protein